MNDKMKFHEMTKPIRFRTFKMCKQYIVLWCKAQRERINYLFNYLLYKLNILKRYSYRDNVEKELPIPHDLRDKEITTYYFGGVSKMRLISSTDIDVDYFYREKKDGSIKKTLILRDERKDTLFAVAHLENIHIKVGSEWYNVDRLPVFKMASFINEPKASFITEDSVLDRPVEPRVVEYDVFKLKTLYHKVLIGYMSPSEVSKSMYNYYYAYLSGKLEKTLNNLTLADIIR